VQEQEQRLLALAAEDVNRAAERCYALTLPLPLLDTLGQP
jgi:hypothetical protein